MPQPTLRKLFWCFAIFLFTSCNKEENFSCKISFFNGVIGGPPITFKADSISIADNIRYDSLKPDAVVPSGTYHISLTRSGQPQNLFLTNLEANEIYTAVVYDSIQRAIFFMRKDVMPAKPGFGRCAVRIYTLIPDAANLYLANDTLKPIITGKTFNDFATGTGSPAFQEMDTIAKPKIYRDSNLVVVPVPAFRTGKIYTLFLTGTIKDSLRLRAKCTVQLHN